MSVRVERIGDATLYLGDCRDIPIDVAEGIDLVLTSPPYGLPRDFKRTSAVIVDGKLIG